MANVWWDGEEVPSADLLRSWRVSAQHLAAGRCPRCRGSVSQQLTFGSVVVTAAADAPDSVDVPVLFRCNCDEKHDGRPAGRVDGCGAWWVARVVTDEGATFRVLPETDTSVRAQTKKVAEASAGSGAAATTAAEKWIPGITALLGLSGLATVVVSRDTGSGFDVVLRGVLFGLVCLSILTAGLATITAYRAAYGWPRKVRLETTGDVLATATLLDERATSAARGLGRAVGLAVTSTVTLLGALGVLWFAPVDANEPTATVTFTSSGSVSSTRCVEILSLSENTVRAKVLTGGPTDTISIPLDQITKLDSAPCEGT